MPINNKYPLSQVMLALQNHIAKTRRKVFIAYIMLQNINDSLSHAQALVKLLKNNPRLTHLFHVDLIPYNVATATSRFKSSNIMQIERFRAFLKGQGVGVTVRTQFGLGVKAGCGQLCVDLY